MTGSARFVAAFPYQDDVLALPVTDPDTASSWYQRHFGMAEVERSGGDQPAVILERDGVRIGFAVNGRDASQDGAAIRVQDIDGIRRQFEAAGVNVSEPRVDEVDGRSCNVFFVVAPDGLCYYIHEPVSE